MNSVSPALRWAALAAVALALVVPSAHAVDPGRTPDQVCLSWTGDPTTTMTVTWRTSEAVDDSVVEYGTDESLGQTVQGTYRDYGTNNARKHVVQLTGLEPDSHYYYRCGSPSSGYSDIYSFSTPPADPCAVLRFAVLGDSRATVTNGVSPSWEEVIAAVAAEDPDFIMMNGDLIKEGDKEDGWDQFFAYADPYLAEIPFLPGWGNHDDRDGSLYRAMFEVPPGPGGEGHYYAVDVGVLHMVALDAEHVEDRWAVQTAWMREDLPANEGKWRLIMSHRPAYSSGTTHGSDEDVQTNWVPVFDEFAVDAYFGSHDHMYERTCPIRNGACVADPADGTVYFVTGGAGAFLNPLGGNEWFTEMFFAKYHYVLVEVGYDTIELEARDQTGTALDRISWTKGETVGPVAAIGALPASATVGEPILFDGTESASCGGSIEAWRWDLGNFQYSEESSFEYAYPEAGTYTVTLTVTDDGYLTDTAEASIEILADADDDDTADDDDFGDDDSAGDDDDDDGCGC